MMKPTISCLLAMALWTLPSCAETGYTDWSAEPTSIRVTLSGGDKGTPDAPLDIPDGSVPYTVDLEVVSAAGGQVLTSFDGWVRMSARPGSLTIGSSVSSVVGTSVQVIAGRASGLDVGLKGAFGTVRLWAEDLGYVPWTSGAAAACSDGADNDGDGLIDVADDPGCLDETDNSEEVGSFASGISEPLYFRNLTIAEMQGKGKESPYQGEIVTHDSGDMMVTRVARDGMYVTDYDDPDGYNHIFVYNFNTPAGVRVCDRLYSLAGTVVEFYGFTELGFPSWELNPWYQEKGPCPLATPRVVTADDLYDNAIMEPLESALVRVTDVTVSDFTVDCDHNGDGLVDFQDYDTQECSSECECRDACEKDSLCTEMNQYHEYGQWAVRVGGIGGEKLWVVTRETIPNHDPFGPGHPQKLKSITGTLRNLRFLRPAWILEPRCPDDLVVEGEPPTIGDTCIFPRTGEDLYEPN